MELKTKYNIGQTIGFKENEKVRVGEIINIDIRIDEEDIFIDYTLDYPEISYNEFGNAIPVGYKVSEENIIGIANIKFI